MSQDQGTVSLGLEHYFFVLRRQWHVIALSSLVGLGLAVGALVVLPPAVTASADVNLNVISTEPFNAQKSAGVLLDGATEARIATSYVVATESSKLLDASLSADEIRRAANVVTNSGTSIVKVSFTAGTTSEAVAGADAVAAAYIGYRGTEADKRIGVMQENINKRIDEQRARIVEANKRTATAKPGSLEAAQAESDRRQISIELEDLSSRKNQLESVDTTGGVILTPAASNEMTVEPKWSTLLATGLFAGLAFGIVLAFVVNRRDLKLRSAAEFERLMGSPVLARLPIEGLQVPAVGKTADYLRVARERLFAEHDEQDMSMFIFDDSGESAFSSAIVNLAVVGAQAERNIVLVLPGMTPSQLSELRESLQLTDSSEESYEAEVLHSKRFPLLSIFVPTDTDDSDQSDLLVTREVRSLLRKQESGTYYIIALKSDAHQSSILAGLRLTSGFLLIGREKHSRADRIRGLLNEAEQLRRPSRGSLVIRGRKHEKERRTARIWKRTADSSR